MALIAVGAGAFAVGGPPLQRFAAGALLLGALGSTWDATAPGYTESWAAVLVTGSVAAYLIRRPLTGATLGIVAVFIRELVVPYVAVCGVLALLRRRTSEALLWAVAGLAYVCYYAAHMRAVRAHQLPADATLAGPWTQGGDLAFLLLTLRANLLFFELPVVLLAAIALLGLVSIGWRSIPRQVSVSLLVYAVLFVWAGHPSRLYWGTLTAPLWAFAVVLCTSAFIAAVSARSTRRRSRPDAAV